MDLTKEFGTDVTFESGSGGAYRKSIFSKSPYELDLQVCYYTLMITSWKLRAKLSSIRKRLGFITGTRMRIQSCKKTDSNLKMPELTIRLSFEPMSNDQVVKR